MINDENTSSISKDCFFFPAKKKTSKVGNGVAKNDLSKERKKLCDEVWGEMETIVNTLHDELQGDLFQQLLKFIHGRNHAGAADGMSQIKISTAVLITGVNMPDHKSLFASLSTNINRNVSPYVVSLQSRQCLNMKTLMKSFGSQLATSLKNDDERSEFEKRGAMVTMSAIEEWYLKNVEQKPSSKGSPSKRRKVDSVSPSKRPVVVIFEDFEAFPRKLLHDFILTSSFHTSKLELVFIFGVSTSWEEVSQRLLSHSSMVHLEIVKFQAPPPSRHLSFIFDKILLTEELPFKLSGKCLQLSLDIFLRYDFSINNFIRSLKFCVLEHFRKQPASIICQITVEKAASLINCMKYEELKTFTALSSVKRYFALMDETRAKEIKSSRNLLQKELVTLVDAIYGYHDNYFVAMKCLHVMTRQLPNLPLGKQLREIFCACHRKPLAELAQFREAFLYLRVSSRDQLVKYFRSCINILDDHLEHVGASPKSKEDPLSPVNYRAELVRFSATLSSDDSDLDYYDSDEYDEEEKAVEEMNKVKYTYQLQQRLREKRAAKTTKKRKTKFEKLREETLLLSRSFFEHNLRPPVTMELYEVFYFDSPQTMKERLISSPRLNIETALSDPFYYIKVKELDNCAYISSSFPDVSIAYKLHLESGSLINLYDWLKAFHVIVTSDNEGDSKDDIDEATQARFVQAVAELQLMGFIKPTKKKIDHIQRLTWS